MALFKLLKTNILLVGITEKIKNETIEQKGGFLGMFPGTF